MYKGASTPTRSEPASSPSTPSRQVAVGRHGARRCSRCRCSCTPGRAGRDDGDDGSASRRRARAPDRFVEDRPRLVRLRRRSPVGVDSRCQFVERVAPLWPGDRGERGMVLNPASSSTSSPSSRATSTAPADARRAVRPVAGGTATPTSRRARPTGCARRPRAPVSATCRVGLLVAGVGRVVTGSRPLRPRQRLVRSPPRALSVRPLAAARSRPRPPRAARTPTTTATPAVPTASPPARRSPTFLADQWAALADACGLDRRSTCATGSGARCSTRGAARTASRASTMPSENESWTVADPRPVRRREAGPSARRP